MKSGWRTSLQSPAASAGTRETLFDKEIVLSRCVAFVRCRLQKLDGQCQNKHLLNPGSELFGISMEVPLRKSQAVNLRQIFTTNLRL